MKKTVRIIIALLLTTASLVLSSCGNVESAGNENTVKETEKCRHSYVSSVIKEPTLKEEGKVEYTCSICGDKFTEQLEKKTVSDDTLMRDFYNCTYDYSVFRITAKEILTYGVSNYELERGTGREAIEGGYLKKSDLDSSVDIDLLYVINVSGNCMVNPELPYYTTFEKQGMTALLLYDNNGKLARSELILCENLRTYALLRMSR